MTSNMAIFAVFRRRNGSKLKLPDPVFPPHLGVPNFFWCFWNIFMAISNGQNRDTPVSPFWSIKVTVVFTIKLRLFTTCTTASLNLNREDSQEIEQQMDSSTMAERTTLVRTIFLSTIIYLQNQNFRSLMLPENLGPVGSVYDTHSKYSNKLF